MNTAVLRHLSFYPFVQALARRRICYLLEAAPGDLVSCEHVCWKRSEPEKLLRTQMQPGLGDGQTQQWTATVDYPEEAHYIKYGFFVEDRSGCRRWLSARGLQENFSREGSFELLQANVTDVVAVPAWAQGCVYYQIFPERFARSGKADASLAAWNAPPTRDNFLGGNFRGIIDRLPYLTGLGVECLYLNPIFEGDFNHKYATTDYFRVDPAFGSMDDLRELVSRCHAAGIRVILDGVFNHTGIHFAPFEDLLCHGPDSRYKDWFYPKAFPLRVDPACYECVGDYPYMPRLNGANPEVRAYVRDVLLYWLREARIDGWRLDVADELDRHAVVWWREEVKRAFPDALLLAETWSDASGLLGPDGFDSAMNYLFRDAMIDYFARGTLTETALANRLHHMLMRYTSVHRPALYNCLGSHDTARFLTEAREEKWRLKLAMAFQMLFPGAPAIYYGDEIGMTGENDPGCRAGMAWDSQDDALLAWQRELIALRKAHPSLRTGSYLPLLSDNDARLFAFARRGEDEMIAAVFNMGEQAQTWDFAGEFVHVLPHSVKILYRPVQKEEEPCVPTGNLSPRSLLV